MAVVESENMSSSDLSDDELADEIATLASQIYAGTCRWLELVAELEAARDQLQEREWSKERGSAEPRRPTSAEALASDYFGVLDDSNRLTEDAVLSLSRHEDRRAA